MNLTNSKSLLLVILCCILMSPIIGTANDANDTLKDQKKELIIVNVDEELTASLTDLADYVLTIYSPKTEDKITIKRYLNAEDGESKEVISELVQLLVSSGISTEHIEVLDAHTSLNHPYFSLAIATTKEVQ